MGDSENFDDAIHWAFSVYNKPRTYNDVQEVLNDKAGETLNKDSKEFWVLVRALRDFMDKEGGGYLPVSTNIPDITAETDDYVELKNMLGFFIFYFIFYFCFCHLFIFFWGLVVFLFFVSFESIFFFEANVTVYIKIKIKKNKNG